MPLPNVLTATVATATFDVRTDGPFHTFSSFSMDLSLQKDFQRLTTIGGYNDDQVFNNNNGKTYTAYCNKRKLLSISYRTSSYSNRSTLTPVDDYGGANLKYFVADSVKACVKACSDYPENKCKRAIWQTSAASGGQTGCWLREWNNVDCVPTTKSTAYSSAHVHDS